MSSGLIGKEYLPNVHIEKIIYHPFDGHSRIKVVACLFDNINRTWSLDDIFSSYLTVNCYLSTNQSVINDLNKGEISLSSIGPNNMLQVVPAAPTINPNTYVHMIRGGKYYKWVYEFLFDVDFDAQDISCYVASAIDIQTLQAEKQMDLRFAGSLSYMGAVKSEKIVSRKKIANFLFRNVETQVPWAGPVHVHTNVGFMEGSQHSSVSHGKLSVEASHSKISSPDYSNFANLAQSQEQTNNVGRRMARDAINLFPSYYQMEFSEDADRNLSNVFFLETESLLRNESLVAGIMQNYNPSLLQQISQNTNINNIQINRHSVSNAYTNNMGLQQNIANRAAPITIARSNNNKSVIKSKTLYKTSPREIFSVNPKTVSRSKPGTVFNGKTITKDLLKQSQKIGEIQQLNLSMPSNFRAVNFVDYDVRNALPGDYKYSIDVSLRDEPYEYCKNLLKELTGYSQKISNLLSVLEKKKAEVDGQFKIPYLQEFYSQYGIQIDDEGIINPNSDTGLLENSYLVMSYKKLIETESLIGRRSPKDRENPLNLMQSDIEKIHNYLSYYKRTIIRFKRLYQLSESGTYEKKKTGNRKRRGVIEKKIFMKQTYKKEPLVPIKMSFVATDILSPLPSIDLNTFNQRSQKEVKKYFPVTVDMASKVFSSVKSDIKDSFNTIQQERFMNFSPARMFFGGKTVDTTQVSAESFDAEFFNSLRVARAALISQQRRFEQENTLSEPEEPEDYIDSREYLGSDAKFNRVLLRALRKKPNGVFKIRKSMRFFDRRLLKLNSKKLSLDKFDISKPNNLVSKIIETNKNTPMQLKALSLLRTPMTTFDIDSIDFDPVSNPQTQEVFEQNYLNIGKVETLSGFEVKNGKIMMNRPIFSEMSQNTVKNMENKNMICRVTQRQIDGIDIDNTGVGVLDKVFMMQNTKENQSKRTRSRAPKTKKYTTRKDDTMRAIAERFNTTVARLEKLNPGISRNKLPVGKQLIVSRVFPQDVNSIADSSVKYYADTPGAVQAGPGGLRANFLAGDYVIAAQDPGELLRQAEELVNNKGTANLPDGQSGSETGDTETSGTGTEGNTTNGSFSDGDVNMLSGGSSSDGGYEVDLNRMTSYPFDITNTVVVQNNNNASVLQFVPLEKDRIQASSTQTTQESSSPAPTTSTTGGSSSGGGYSGGGY